MATWVAHFRMAQAILEQGYDFHRQMFLIGNIAPDSGMLTDDRRGYIPDKSVSHWRNADKVIEPECFYDIHLAQRPDDNEAYAFLVGFYCHLIADLEWMKRIWKPKMATPLYAEPMAEDRQYIWEIKKDWYGLDFLYLYENPDSIFYTDFVHIESVPDYLPDFPEGAFTNRAKDTKAFYLNNPDWDLDRPYIYLNREEWDTYVNETIQVISKALSDRV